jgi:hypothetical protein
MVSLLKMIQLINFFVAVYIENLLVDNCIIFGTMEIENQNESHILISTFFKEKLLLIFIFHPVANGFLLWSKSTVTNHSCRAPQ